MENYKMFINGVWKDSVSGETSSVNNPATGEILGTVPHGGSEDTKKAIDAANTAFKTWSKTTANERSELLKNWFNLIVSEKENIAKIMTLEQGKPLHEAEAEVLYAASFVEWYAEEAKRIYGETIPAWKPNKRIMVTKQPVGVVGAITPWNFPAAMITRKLAPALAAGCTVVTKPAPQTPLTAIKLFELLEKAGFPKGTANLVTGDAEKIGMALTEDRKVKKITFTGSTEVGKKLMSQASGSIKRLSLELGGHAPFIVFEDADLDKAIEGALASKFRNCGQACIASNRFYIQENVMDKFVEKLKSKLESFKIGNGLENGIDLGPVIDKKAYEKINRHIEDAVSKGGEILLGGKGFKEGDLEDSGYFFTPTILSNLSQDMIVMSEETFGPVVPVVSFKTEEELINLANNTNYGLAAYVYTESLSRGIKITEELEYGIVGLNDGAPSTAQAPFGGFKESGVAREGGHYGLEAFLEVKYISIGL